MAALLIAYTLRLIDVTGHHSNSLNGYILHPFSIDFQSQGLKLNFNLDSDSYDVNYVFAFSTQMPATEAVTFFKRIKRLLITH